MLKARLRQLSRRTRRTVLVGSASLALAGVASACSPQFNSPSAAALYRLRMCESGGNYAINTGNGYYGAYQFNLGTWQSLGFGGTPNAAPAWVQDQAVIMLWRQRGWAPWPVCGAGL